jgi:hypothetical protein
MDRAYSHRERLGGQAWIIAESNNMGGPIVEQLHRDRLPVLAFTTTNASKSAIIEALTLAFERGDIRILNDAALIGELQAFVAKSLPSGMMRYAAPEGGHDDIVIAVAIARSGLGLRQRRAQVQYMQYDGRLTTSPRILQISPV